MPQPSQPSNRPFDYQRRQTRDVRVGNIGIGGDNPIRVQSMTTTDTLDVAGTVEQSIRMIDAGCELVRITAPSKREAQRLEDIGQALKDAGHSTPLVADIHFTPNAAEIAADFVEKVRVNPGNYADKKRFETIDYTDEGYEAELDRIREKFTPLVQKCKALGRAMRIGTNHGSLSDRIMSRYGDTPLGMVESALEFLRICVDEDYLNVVVSMKSSNALVMVQAYRLLVHRMDEEGMNFPLHLGVTEAGDGEDGRIKSALGIGTLLEEGLGDTIRVSLTEEPEAEMPVARMLVERYENRHGHPSIGAAPSSINPFEYQRREVHEVSNLGGPTFLWWFIRCERAPLSPPACLAPATGTASPWTSGTSTTRHATGCTWASEPSTLTSLGRFKCWWMPTTGPPSNRSPRTTIRSGRLTLGMGNNRRPKKAWFIGFA